MGAGGEADEQDACGRIAERGNGSAPVFGFSILTPFNFGNGEAMLTESIAALAFDDALVEQGERGGFDCLVGGAGHTAIVEGPNEPGGWRRMGALRKRLPDP